MLKNKVILFMLFLVSINLFSVGNSESQSVDSGKITVFTSVLSQKFFVKEIAGDRINVEVLVGPGKSPATYQPTPNQIMNLSGSEVLFTIGVPFENGFLNKIESTLKNIKIVDTSQGIKKIAIASHHHDEDEHDEDEHDEDGHDEDEHDEDADHDHEGGLDPHVWLSPVLAKTISENIYNTLVEIDPEGEAIYSAGYNNLLEKLDAVHAELHEMLEPIEGNILFVYHPSFGYFAEEYHLHQEAIETGGKEPTTQQLTEIIEEAQNDGVKLIIVQPEFSQKSAQIIADSIGGTVTTLNPLSDDYINNLKEIANTILAAYN